MSEKLGFGFNVSRGCEGGRTNAGDASARRTLNEPVLEGAILPNTAHYQDESPAEVPVVECTPKTSIAPPPMCFALFAKHSGALRKCQSFSICDFGIVSLAFALFFWASKARSTYLVHFPSRPGPGTRSQSVSYMFVPRKDPVHFVDPRSTKGGMTPKRRKEQFGLTPGAVRVLERSCSDGSIRGMTCLGTHSDLIFVEGIPSRQQSHVDEVVVTVSRALQVQQLENTRKRKGTTWVGDEELKVGYRFAETVWPSDGLGINQYCRGEMLNGSLTEGEVQSRGKSALQIESISAVLSGVIGLSIGVYAPEMSTPLPNEDAQLAWFYKCEILSTPGRLALIDKPRHLVHATRDPQLEIVARPRPLHIPKICTRQLGYLCTLSGGTISGLLPIHLHGVRAARTPHVEVIPEQLGSQLLLSLAASARKRRARIRSPISSIPNNDRGPGINMNSSR
ncbi:hypothetical protein BXZ70DRAFT_907953 [Cristinia sonorae]|uniref:Uncharacterized protein n=1 Tax=Cristinia sonorae TaxID=1940300 RepID=A0A8K0ULR9_9AGAR|nr:hypothetical protein BXZ70DRAFT_907953 [Cristinia sonorae]